MNYWIQNGFPRKMVLAVFTGRGVRYHHVQSLWIDFEVGVIVATESKCSRWDIHDPGRLAIEDKGSTVLEYWEAKLKGERPRWVDNGQLKSDAEIPINVLNGKAETVIFPKGTTVRFLNQLTMDAMTGRIIEKKEIVDVVGWYPDLYYVGVDTTYARIKENMPNYDHWLTFEGGQWSVYSFDTNKIPDSPGWPRDARTREGRMQKAALDAFHKDTEWMRKLGLQNHLWDAWKYGACSSVSYRARSHTLGYSFKGERLPSAFLMDRTPRANRRTWQDVLKYWLRKAKQGAAEFPDELFAKHKKRHEKVEWLRRKLFNQMPNEKAMVKAVRRHAAKLNLPNAQTMRLLRMLAAGSALRAA